MPHLDPEDKRKYHRIYQRVYSKERLESHPWEKALLNIRSRCNNKAHHYYKRGIKNFLTLEAVKVLWFRDSAYNMDNPSIDRIDSTQHYTFDNCRFLELTENLKRERKSHGQLWPAKN
jgi:hypothetical protein